MLIALDGSGGGGIRVGGSADAASPSSPGRETRATQASPLQGFGSGSIISDSVRAKLRPDASHQVGTLLAYTWNEWNVDVPAKAG